MRRGYNKKSNGVGYLKSARVNAIMPLSLKPKKIVRKVVYNNLIQVTNNLLSSTTGSGTVQPQFMTLNLNSPWMVNSLLYAAPNTCGWTPNRTLDVFTNNSNPTSGTSYPGLFELTNSPGNTYRQSCIVGSKVTLTYTPTVNNQNTESQPTAFFGVISTGPSNFTSTNLNCNKVYDSPYSKVSKIIGFGSGTSGNINKQQKSGFLQFKYNPKNYNMVKDISDTKSLWANVVSGSGSHPSEIDRLVFGICPLMIGNNSVPLVSGIVQLRIEATMLFAEPDIANNLGPSIPIPDVDVAN